MGVGKGAVLAKRMGSMRGGRGDSLWLNRLLLCRDWSSEKGCWGIDCCANNKEEEEDVVVVVDVVDVVVVDDDGKMELKKFEGGSRGLE